MPSPSTTPQHNAIDSYLRDVETALATGHAGEHAYRAYLQHLLEGLSPGITTINEPKRIACGAPDLAASRTIAAGPITIGYLEAENLAKDAGGGSSPTMTSPITSRSSWPCRRRSG